MARLIHGAVWTVGAYGVSQVLRLGTNVVLTKLLAPELFGLMVLVNTLSMGIQLISDVGIGQNIICNRNGNDPDFYNTAWSIQILRGFLIWVIFVLGAGPIAHFYELPDLITILLISSVSIIIGGFESIGPSLLRKRLEFAKINTYMLLTGIVNALILPLFAYLDRTVWALVLGGIVTSAVSSVASFFLGAGTRLRFRLERRYVREIIGFGKWVFLSSIVYFLSGSVDRLYFAKAVPLSLLGVYGIARSIADMLAVAATQLGNNVVFPFVSSHADMPRRELREQLIPIRARFLLLCACGFSVLIVTSDLVIKLLYDERYAAASWMLPVLAVGAWFSVIATLNEATLMGLGAPSYSAYTNGLRFALLAVGLPLSFRLAGLAGCIVTLAAVEMLRSTPIFIGQRRERFSFVGQDVRYTIILFIVAGLLEGLRWTAGFGTSFDSVVHFVQR